jgi:hypothetical protein
MVTVMLTIIVMVKLTVKKTVEVTVIGVTTKLVSRSNLRQLAMVVSRSR